MAELEQLYELQSKDWEGKRLRIKVFATKDGSPVFELYTRVTSVSCFYPVNADSELESANFYKDEKVIFFNLCSIAGMVVNAMTLAKVWDGIEKTEMQLKFHFVDANGCFFNFEFKALRRNSIFSKKFDLIEIDLVD